MVGTEASSTVLPQLVLASWLTMTTLVITNPLALAEVGDGLSRTSFPVTTLELAGAVLADTLVSAFGDVERFAFAPPEGGFKAIGERSDVVGFVLPVVMF